ncbi:MAG: protein of unknown function [Nitrospira sp.]
MTGARSTRRYPNLRSIGYVLFGSGLCLILFVLYLQTTHAFTHVIVPLVDSLLPGDLHAENGSLTLPAAVDVTGLSYQEPDIGLALNVGRLHLSLSAMRSLRERLLFIDDVMIDHAEIGIAVTQKDSGAAADASSSDIPLRWVVRRGHMNEGTLFVKTDHKDVAVTDVQGTVEDIGSGRSGTIDGQGEVAVLQQTSGSRWAGRMVVTGSVRQDPNGRRIEWDAANEVIVRESPPSASGMLSGILSFDQRVTGSYDLMDAALQAEVVVTARLGQRRLVDASVTLRRTGAGEGAETDLGVRIHEVTEHALNLLMDEQQAFRLRASHVGGYIDVHAVGSRYAVRSVLAGEKLQVMVDRTVTPPLDIDLAQTGTFDSESRDLMLEIFDMHVADQRKIWLTGELTRTLTFKLGAGHAEREDLEPSNPSQTDWAIKVNDLSVTDLRRWFDAFRWKGLDGLRAGRVGGVMTASGRSSGKAVDLSLRLSVSDLVMDAEGAELGPPVTFEHVARGTLTDFTQLRISSFVTTASVSGERSKGTLECAGTINLSDPATDLDLRGSLVLNDLHAGALNPLLARWTMAGFNHGHFNGTAQASMTGAWFKWEIDLRGRQIGLHLPKKPRPTLPVDVVVRQAGHVDRTGRVLQIDKAVLQTVQQSRPILTAVLDHPIHVALSRTERSRATAREDGPLATLGIEIHQLDIEQLKPRLEFLKLAVLEQITSGFVNARLTIRWWGDTEPLTIGGNLDLERVTVDAHVARISKPLTLRNRIEVTVTDSSLVELTTWNLRALDGAVAIAEARVSGTTDLAEGTMDLSTRFSTGNVTQFLIRIGLLDKPTLTLMAGGVVTAEVRASSQVGGSPLSLRIGIRSRNLRLKPLPKHVMTYDVDVRGTVEVNGPRTAVTLDPLALTLTHAAKEAGTITVWGHWPIVASESEATARIVVKNLDCGPGLDLYGALPGRHAGRFPLNADLRAALDMRKGNVTLSGEETIGPVLVSRKDGGPAEATVRLEQDVGWHDMTLTVSKVTLTADRPHGTTDHAAASGRFSFGTRLGAEFEGKVASLDAAWYAALLSKQSAASRSAAQAEGGAVSKPPGKQSDAQVLITHLDGVLSIGTVSYGGLMMGPGRLTVRGTEDRIDLAVEPTGLADGQVEGTMALTDRQGRGRLEWTGKGESLNIETILSAIEPGETARMTGVGSFQTSGNAVPGGALPEEQTKGSLDFTITGGQFTRIPLANFLARETHIEEFNRMGFSEFRGEVRWETGEIHMNRIVATGSVSSLEGSGKLGSDGALDGLVFVKIGPSFRRNIKIPCMSAILLLPDGFAALPFAVRISGTAKVPVYRVDPSPWGQAKGTITDFAGKMKNLVMGCRESS